MNRQSISLWWHLAAWSFGAALIGWMASIALLSSMSAQQKGEDTDHLLSSIAAVLARQGVSEFASDRPSSSPQELSIFIWSGSGGLLTSDGSARELPFSSNEGFSTVVIGSPSEAWRSFSRWDTPERHRKIAVMVKVAERESAAQALLATIASPLGWLLPVLAVLVGVATYCGLRPLRRVCAAVERRDGTSSAPLERTPYTELNRIVEALNDRTPQG
jgi:two-component system sensor histidine kinase QseC